MKGVIFMVQQISLYYQMSTTNKSFLEIHRYLQDSGIQNNKFMLALLDPDLARIDPHDPMISPLMKQKVLRECLYNPWYFFREVIRIPDSGQNTGVKFQLHRGNLALLFCLMLNLNTFLEQPRQTGKTIGGLCWYLYLFNFGTANSEMSFLNKKFEDSKLNLQRIKDIRSLLPSYLKMDEAYAADGSRLKGRNNVETMQHIINGNHIRTVPSARSKVAAASLMRGRTTPIIYIDEYAFIPYNETIYTNMAPAFNTAANNAKRNNRPYGMLITTTPGMLTTEEGVEAFQLKESATVFSERWYDLSQQQIMDIVNSNTNSNFVYIKYTYQQLGKSEEWFKDLCILMKKDWDSIRREVLLEWANSSENSPFKPEDLDTIKGLLRQPINTILLLNKFEFRIYEKVNLRYPPLIGVDVSGGFKRDSSAITVVDSYSTRVTAELNCNFISTKELALVLHSIVSQWMPNAVVNIERNGGFGSSVITMLLHTSIKKNLFFTIKDKVIEERFNGATMSKHTQKTKVYGSDSTKSEREELMEILRERVEYHKDKIISPIIYQELCGLEVKKNGKIEHSTNTHDDQIFSWLWALYIYYYGGDLMRNWGIEKHTLKTDAELEEAIVDIREDKLNIQTDLIASENEEIQQQIDVLNKSPGKLGYEQWMHDELQKDEDTLKKLLTDKRVRDGLGDKYSLLKNQTNVSDSYETLPNEVFINFNKSEDEINIDTVNVGNLSSLWGGGEE